MANARIAIPVQSNEGEDHSAECAECVRQRFLRRTGVRQVRVDRVGTEARIELDYDAGLVTWGELEREIRRNGGCFADGYGHAVLHVEGMVSTQGEQLIEASLRRMPGVLASASYASQLVRVEFDRRRCEVPQILRRLGDLGFRAYTDAGARSGDRRKTPQDQEASPAWWLPRIIPWLGRNPGLLMPLLGGGLLGAAAVSVHVEAPAWMRAVLLIGSIVCSSWYTSVESIRTLRQLRFNVEVLMFLAAGGAVILGRYEEAALLLMLFGLGTAGENLAMDRARRAIKALADLAPETAILRDEQGQERETPVSSLVVGDQVIVRPFARIPVDGTVYDGSSNVDQSPITGESMPVEKGPGDSLFAGTINGDQSLNLIVSRPASESKLAKIIGLVEEAQTTKSPTQMLTDRVERFYVPVVLVLTVGIIVGPPMLGAASWADWFYRAMAFLTAASPCALAIGTPAAVLCGIARAAQIGVLIKGGVHLENLGRVRAMAFDKTGTLTLGRARVTDVVGMAETTESEVLTLAAGVEQKSHHPLAMAIVAEARARGLAVPDTVVVKEIPGRGVSGQVAGRRIVVGRRIQVDSGNQEALVAQTVLRFEEEGKTAVVVSDDARGIGVIALADHPRPAAREVLREIRALGVRWIVMLTGDNVKVAASVARDVGADEFHGALFPEDKVRLLGALARQYGACAMVGDGVNDAPALASAMVSIAMGASGTDVALETADIALMSDDLRRLPAAIALSRFSRRIIRQNLLMALGVIVVMAPTAALGGATLGTAVVFHEGSTVLVVLNALRLLMFRSTPGDGSRTS